MNYEEFRRQLGKAGLTIKGFAALIKQSPNSITNYAQNGQVPSHLAIIATLMGEMADNGIDYQAALAKVQLREPRAREGSRRGIFGKKTHDMRSVDKGSPMV